MVCQTRTNVGMRTHLALFIHKAPLHLHLVYVKRVNNQKNMFKNMLLRKKSSSDVDFLTWLVGGGGTVREGIVVLQDPQIFEYCLKVGPKIIVEIQKLVQCMREKVSIVLCQKDHLRCG